MDLLIDTKAKQDSCHKVDKKKLLQVIHNVKLSPSRIACTNFIMNFLLKNFKDRKIKVLDFGCGSGNYTEIFNKITSNKLINYLGIDVKDHGDHKFIKNKNKNYNFLIEHIRNVNSIKIDFQPNLVFSHSVLEHVKNDKNIIKTLLERFPNICHLHLVPAAASGINYLGHGYRRYKLIELRNIFKKYTSDFKIYPIGGKECMVDYFSWRNSYSLTPHPLDRFFLRQSNYNIDKMESYSNIKKNEYPIFYAVVVN